MALPGLVSGAASGAAAGSVAGPWGTAIGAGVGALAGGLFGGTKYKTDPYGALNPEQVQLTKALGPQLTSMAGKTGADYQYQGQLTSPYTTGEQSGLDNYNRLNAMDSTTLSSLMNLDPTNLNQQFQAGVADPAYYNFNKYTSPAISESYAGDSGYYGSARGTAIQSSANDLANNLATLRFQYGQQAQQNALQAGQNLQTMGTTSAALNAAPREVAQAGLDRAYQNYVQGNQTQQKYIDQMLGFLGISTGTTTQDTTGQNILSGATAGANIGSSISANSTLQQILKSLQQGNTATYS